MIVSMKPPYEITARILNLISSISIKIGEVNANYLNKQSPQLRKQNKIKTVHSSLSIEGNTLTEDQVSAILENKRVVGPKKDIIEVINALKVYESLNSFKPYSSKSFLEAHKILMSGLVDKAGSYRKQSVGIVKGEKLAHLAPPFENVPYLMNNLFEYLKSKDELTLIKSCVFHYEMEFIHPFIDGNGRSSRLVMNLVLLQHGYVIANIKGDYENRMQYYNALETAQTKNKKEDFLMFIAQIEKESLERYLKIIGQ